MATWLMASEIPAIVPPKIGDNGENLKEKKHFIKIVSIRTN